MKDKMKRLTKVEQMAGRIITRAKILNFGETLGIVFDDESYILFEGVVYGGGTPDIEVCTQTDHVIYDLEDLIG